MQPFPKNIEEAFLMGGISSKFPRVMLKQIFGTYIFPKFLGNFVKN